MNRIEEYIPKTSRNKPRLAFSHILLTFFLVVIFVLSYNFIKGDSAIFDRERLKDSIKELNQTIEVKDQIIQSYRKASRKDSIFISELQRIIKDNKNKKRKTTITVDE